MGFILGYIIFFALCIVIAKLQTPLWFRLMGGGETINARSELKIISNAVGIIAFVIANIWFVLQLVSPSIMAFNDNVLLVIKGFLGSSEYSTLPLMVKAVCEIVILTSAVWLVIALLVGYKVRAYRSQH